MTRTRYDYSSQLAAANVRELLKLDGYNVEQDGNWITTDAPHAAVQKAEAELWPAGRGL